MSIGSRFQTITGATAIAQGASLALMVCLVIEPALWMASLLYAEDFDRLNSVPDWFRPLNIAMMHRFLLEVTFFSLGAVLIIFGALHIKPIQPSHKNILVAAAAALTSSLLLVAVLNPLYKASVLSSVSWAAGAPAFLKLEELYLATSIAWINVAISALSVSFCLYSSKNLTTRSRSTPSARP